MTIEEKIKFFQTKPPDRVYEEWRKGIPRMRRFFDLASSREQNAAESKRRLTAYHRFNHRTWFNLILGEALDDSVEARTLFQPVKSSVGKRYFTKDLETGGGTMSVEAAKAFLARYGEIARNYRDAGGNVDKGIKLMRAVVKHAEAVSQHANRWYGARLAEQRKIEFTFGPFTSLTGLRASLELVLKALEKLKTG